MKKVLLLCLPATIVITSSVAIAQIPFQHTYGGTQDEVGTSVQQTNDGGYIIGGSTQYSFSTSTASDFYLVKIKPDGTPEWSKTFGGSTYEEGYSVQQTNDGGFIFTGRENSFGPGDFDIYLVKTGSNGNLEWSKTFGGTANEEGYSVQQTNEGGFIIAGSTASFGAGDKDIYLVKTASDGTLEWSQTYGGTNTEHGYSVQQTNDEGFIITGREASFGAGGSDVYLVKTTSDGTMEWSKIFGGSNGNDWGTSVKQTNDGGYAIGGYTGSFGAGGNDVYLIKTGSDGSAEWSKTFGSTSDDYGYALQQTTNGEYILTGYTNNYSADTSDVYLVKTATDGSLQWSKAFGGTGIDYGLAVQQTNDDGYTVTGVTRSFGAGNYDMYCIKTGSNGSSICNDNKNVPITTTTDPATLTSDPATIQQTPATVSGDPPTVESDPATLNSAVSFPLFSHPAPAICLVTVDSLSRYNQIIWDKTLFTNTIDSFIVYREISTNDFKRIGAVPYTSLSMFVDTVRKLYFPNSGNPNAGTYRYKLQAHDTCGNYSALSPYHNTIFITNNAGNFSWTQLYTIEGSSNPVTSYVLMRDDMNNGNWNPVNSVSGNQQNITDPDYATWALTANWRVEANWNISCTPTIKNPLPASITTTRSNAIKIIVTGQNENVSANSVMVYPNPASDKVGIFLSKESEYKASLLDLTGKCFLQTKTFTDMLNMNVKEIPAGLYLVEVINIKTNEKITSKVIVKK